jgi:Zn-dependent peptidase ImmA (M78 family)/transcriptional regulator with XRE-family HTH domain
MEEQAIARVRAVIDASGMTQKAVAATIGIDASKLTKSLKGLRRFSSYELAALAEFGGRTVEWMLTGVERPQLSFAHRATLSATSTTNSGRDHATNIAEKFEDARELGFAPQSVKLPRMSTRGGYVAQAEAAAQYAVTQLASPLSELNWAGLVRTVEQAFSVNVAVEELPDGIDGLSYVDGDLRLMIVATTDRTGRQRFTLAHELGHILFGDNGSEVIEEQIFSTKGHDHDESRANAFAAAFLMPRSEIERILGGREVAEAFRNLVWSFRVSPDSMAWRLQNLGLISDPQRRALDTEPLPRLAAVLGRMEEHRRRIEESTQGRAPGRLADAYIGAYLHGHIGAAPVSDISGLPVETVERLLDDVEYPDRWPNSASGE